MMNTLLTFIGETVWTLRAWAKLTALALAALVAVSIIVAVVGTVFRLTFYGGSGMPMQAAMRAFAPTAEYGMGGGGGMMADMMEPAYDGYAMEEKMMVQNYEPSSIMPPVPSVNGGQNAELYERASYDARYETRKLSALCDSLEELKPLEYVLFDGANRSEHSCWYRFRVETERAEEVLATLKGLGPIEISSNVETVAQNIEDSSDRIAALKRQRASVDATLAQAERAYDDAIRRVGAGSVAGLGQLVTDKLSMMERLTNTRTSLDEQIRALELGSDDVIDDTAYTHFSASVSRITLVDWRGLADSWRYAFQNAIREASEILSSIILTIPVLVLRLAWYLVVALASIVALALFARGAWYLVVRIWQWGKVV